jgi:hypothetical protein
VQVPTRDDSDSDEANVIDGGCGENFHFCPCVTRRVDISASSPMGIFRTVDRSSILRMFRSMGGSGELNGVAYNVEVRPRTCLFCSTPLRLKHSNVRVGPQDDTSWAGNCTHSRSRGDSDNYSISSLKEEKWGRGYESQFTRPRYSEGVFAIVEVKWRRSRAGEQLASVASETPSRPTRGS